MSLRILLLPLSMLYWIAVFFKNKFYDWGIFTQKRFDFPVISVGNLTTGGTGKTPHIEYLVRLLSTDKNVATLSRGYGRKTSGFHYVFENSKPEIVGDEPLQLKSKFNKITVAVCESRKPGIQRIVKDNPITDVVLLDDAFQHRAVKAGLSVLLLEYSKIFKSDFLLPAGNLREPFSSKKRADIIVVSKCPAVISDEERKRITEKTAPDKNQKLFFSSLAYAAEIKSVFSSEKLQLTSSANILLVTGIADATAIKSYIETQCKLIKHISFSDHHNFSNADIKAIAEIFSTIAKENIIILTTEKDAMRLRSYEALKKLPLYYLPVEVVFRENDKEGFNKTIIQYVGKN
ncbi:MAG: tetraacyldisaccharide 4'-kinase [Bacteroidia bacterium]